MKDIIDEYYSLDKKENLERCKIDPVYLGEVIEKNENLIWFTINKYIGNLNYLVRYNIDKEDLLQVGKMALIKAINSFDPSKGTKFSSFAVVIIKREIKVFIYNNSTVLRIPREVRKLKTIINHIQDSLGYLPSITSISKTLNSDEEQVQKIIQIDQNPLYLDELQEVDYSQQFLFVEPLITNNEDDFSTIFVDTIFKKLEQILSPLELQVLKLKMDGYKQVDIAKKLNISDIKVSRILKKAAPYIQEILTDSE
jgi:RNA polymerase sigma factor (sigma-70 family)